MMSSSSPAGDWPLLWGIKGPWKHSSEVAAALVGSPILHPPKDVGLLEINERGTVQLPKSYRGLALTQDSVDLIFQETAAAWFDLTPQQLNPLGEAYDVLDPRWGKSPRLLVHHFRMLPQVMGTPLIALRAALRRHEGRSGPCPDCSGGGIRLDRRNWTDSPPLCRCCKGEGRRGTVLVDMTSQREVRKLLTVGGWAIELCRSPPLTGVVPFVWVGEPKQGAKGRVWGDDLPEAVDKVARLVLDLRKSTVGSQGQRVRLIYPEAFQSPHQKA